MNGFKKLKYHLSTLKMVIIGVGVVALIAIEFLWFYRSETETLNFRCAADLYYTDKKDEAFIQANVVIQFRKDGSGYFSIDGNVNNEAVVKNVKREINFLYRHSGSNVYLVSSKGMIKNYRDNAPDALLLQFPWLDKTSHYVQITKFHNAYAIGNLHAPFMMCIAQ